MGAVIRRIKRIAYSIKYKPIYSTSGVYEIDEVWTYAGTKFNEVWITYALERNTKSVIAFRVGARTKENIRQVVSPILATNPSRLCTDGLNIYKYLVFSQKTSTLSD